jgi:hypothetical protein
MEMKSDQRVPSPVLSVTNGKLCKGAKRAGQQLQSDTRLVTLLVLQCLVRAEVPRA